MSKKRTISKEFKMQIINEYENTNQSYNQLAEKYNLYPVQISNWVKQYQKFGEEYFNVEHRGRKSKKETVDLESMSLEEQNHYLKMENDILKKAIALNLI